MDRKQYEIVSSQHFLFERKRCRPLMDLLNLNYQTKIKKIKLKMWEMWGFPLNNFVYCGNQLNAYIITWYRITYKSKLNWKIPPFQCGNGNCWLGFYWKWMNEHWAVILPKFYHLELFLHFDIKLWDPGVRGNLKPNINILIQFAHCLHSYSRQQLKQKWTQYINTFSCLIKF